MPRHSITALSSLSLLASWLVAPSASALGYIDTQALNLADHAMTTEYLQMHFDAAEKELKQALLLCGPGACAPQVVARVHRDLGVIYIVGMRRTAAGKAELTGALKADPGVRLDPDLTTPELDAAFKSAAAALGITPGEATKSAPPEPPPEAPAETTAPAMDEPAEAPAASAGTMSHVPPTEQTVNTPLPLYVEASSSFKAADVHYKPYGETEWKRIAFTPMKGGWGIEIPCLDLGTTGKLSYYIDAYDPSGAVVASSGSREQPHEVAIVTDLAAEPPHLPGRAPPSKCSEASDCPPDFPGCESKDSLSKEGKSKSSGPERKNWIGLGIQQDFLVVGGTKGVCDGAAGYTCFRPNDAYYDVTPLSTANGEVAGGVSVATTRLLVAYDRVLGDNWTIGVRAGYAFGGGPTAPGGSAFLPAHAEGRGAYFFGKAPFERQGLRPFLQVSGGLAQIDTEISVRTYDDQQSFQSAKSTQLSAWRKAGTEFASVGGGVAYALGAQHAILAEVRFMQMFGLPASGLGLDVGYAFGL